MNQEIKLFGSGEQIRNVMYAEDAAEIMWRAAQEPKLFGETYFATGSEHLSVLNIAKAIVAVFQRGSVNHIEWPEERLRIEIEHVKFSSARLQNITGWQPRFDFASGLQKTKAIMENINSRR